MSSSTSRSKSRSSSRSSSHSHSRSRSKHSHHSHKKKKKHKRKRSRSRSPEYASRRRLDFPSGSRSRSRARSTSPFDEGYRTSRNQYQNQIAAVTPQQLDTVLRGLISHQNSLISANSISANSTNSAGTSANIYQQMIKGSVPPDLKFRCACIVSTFDFLYLFATTSYATIYNPNCLWYLQHTS